MVSEMSILRRLTLSSAHPTLSNARLLHVLSGLSAPFNAERVPYLYWSLNLSFLNFPCTVWCRVSVCWGCHDWFALEIIGAAGGVTKSTLCRMGDHSQSLSQPASVSTPSQLFHIKAVNCDFTVRVLHNCFTNREEGLLWQILCQEVEGGWGERKPVPDWVHVNNYADRCRLLYFGEKGLWMGVGGWLAGEREQADYLLLGWFSKKSNCSFNTSFSFKWTVYSMKAFIPLVGWK